MLALCPVKVSIQSVDIYYFDSLTLIWISAGNKHGLSQNITGNRNGCVPRNSIQEIQFYVFKRELGMTSNMAH